MVRFRYRPMRISSTLTSTRAILIPFRVGGHYGEPSGASTAKRAKKVLSAKKNLPFIAKVTRGLEIFGKLNGLLAYFPQCWWG